MSRTKEGIRNGRVVLGGWRMTGSPEVAGIMAGEGFDFIGVDMEHAPTGTEGFYRIALAAHGTDCDLLARLPSCDPVLAKQVLDLGASGIIVPSVKTPAEAAQAVAMARFPLDGIRGASLCRASGFGRRFSSPSGSTLASSNRSATPSSSSRSQSSCARSLSTTAGNSACSASRPGRLSWRCSTRSPPTHPPGRASSSLSRFSQVEYCHNLIFKRSAGLSNLFDRIIDRSRNVGRPDLLATFFGTKTYRSQRGKLQTKIIDRDKAHPVIKTWYKKGSIKQYEKEGRLLRTECIVNNTYDVGVQRSLRNLAALRQKMADINQRYLEWLDPIFLSLVEDGALESLSETPVVGMRRIPGIKIENRRLMAVVQSLPHFCNVPAGFTTHSLRDQAVETHRVEKEYTLSQVRYDLGKLRAKGLIERVPGRHHYRFTCVGLNTCALLTKLRSSFFGPLLSLARQSRPDNRFDITSNINRCYGRIDGALKTLMAEVGIAHA